MSITEQIRSGFISYFKQRGHAEIPSSSVVPHDDPSLLFINAGMNQFKDVFLGKATRDYSRAVTSQKCIRVGGKHNDLENVGHTTRHLTFFEMLGNFSFGDYFKKEAIAFAWEVATQVFGFEPEKIWPTVFTDDDEAFELWLQHVPAKRIVRFGEKENFWAMGDTGPCGPCSELLYDRGAAYGSAASPLEDLSGERYLEFWNLVFMQYNRSASGVLEPLPKPSIDTGAGLERVVSLKMGVASVFETDLLRSLIAQVEQVSGRAYHPDDHKLAPAFRVIADHLRCLSFAIADGAQPSNVERGYVLRKVLRRAVRYGRMLGMEEPFLAKILPRLVSEMGQSYRELVTSQSRIAEIMTVEEEAFIRTLKRGGNILNQIVERAAQHAKLISGDDAFKLKDTYGLPLDEILLLAKDSDLQVDTERYNQLEAQAKERSRSAQKSTQQEATANLFAEYVQVQGESEFVGYNEESKEATIQGIVSCGNFVSSIGVGEEGMILLSKTPFYAEMGGQMGDSGEIRGESKHFQVTDCTAPYKGVHAHFGKVINGSFNVGDSVVAAIDSKKRTKIGNNHTATHLLHWALHRVLGEHVKQAGSVVDDHRLRFDFSHHKPLTHQEIVQIEDLVNEKIRENLPVGSYEMRYEEAQKQPEIKQFFGEKYASTVRVVDIDFSKELCGGTHTARLGNIGLFRIQKEGSIAAGVRRIEALTGKEAECFTRESDEMLSAIAASLKAQPGQLKERIEALSHENAELQAELKGLKKIAFEAQVGEVLKNVVVVEGVSVIVAKVDLDLSQLRACADAIGGKLQNSVVLLGASNGVDKCQIFVRLSDALVAKGMNANAIVKELSPLIEGSGGGKPGSAQAGGKAIGQLTNALNKGKELCMAALALA